MSLDYPSLWWYCCYCVDRQPTYRNIYALSTTAYAGVQVECIFHSFALCPFAFVAVTFDITLYTTTIKKRDIRLMESCPGFTITDVPSDSSFFDRPPSLSFANTSRIDTRSSMSNSSFLTASPSVFYYIRSITAEVAYIDRTPCGATHVYSALYSVPYLASSRSYASPQSCSKVSNIRADSLCSNTL